MCLLIYNILNLTPCVLVCVVCACAHTQLTLSMCSYLCARHLMFQCKFFTLRNHLCVRYTAGQAFMCTALTLLELCVKWAAHMCLMWNCAFHTSMCVRVCKLKPVYLFPLWPVCLRYWVSLSALHMLVLTLLDCWHLIMWAHFRHPAAAAAVMD